MCPVAELYLPRFTFVSEQQLTIVVPTKPLPIALNYHRLGTSSTYKTVCVCIVSYELQTNKHLK